jgi:hypothetical protein
MSIRVTAPSPNQIRVEVYVEPQPGISHTKGSFAFNAADLDRVAAVIDGLATGETPLPSTAIVGALDAVGIGASVAEAGQQTFDLRVLLVALRKAKPR